MRYWYCRKMSHVSLDQGGDGQLTPGLRLMAGAMAGIVGMSATYPMDMVSAGYLQTSQNIN